jgi:allantoicase
LYGSIAKSKKLKKKINLASLLDGASVIACNNEHFGKAENILAPGKAKNMGDGWETRRRRGKGNDWLILNSFDGKVLLIKLKFQHIILKEIFLVTVLYKQLIYQYKKL